MPTWTWATLHPPPAKTAHSHCKAELASEASTAIVLGISIPAFAAWQAAPSGAVRASCATHLDHVRMPNAQQILQKQTLQEQPCLGNTASTLAHHLSIIYCQCLNAHISTSQCVPTKDGPGEHKPRWPVGLSLAARPANHIPLHTSQ